MTAIPLVIDAYHGDRIDSLPDAFAAGYRGFIHKATQGRRVTDPTYASRREEAVDAGFLCGAYHYLDAGDMEGQAHRFIDVARPTEVTELAADHEEEGVTLAALIAFLTVVHDQTGRRPLIYSGSVLKEQLAKASAEQKQFLAAHRLWLSHYSAHPKWPSLWTKPWLIQFTGDGVGPLPHTVPGVPGSSGNVDISSFDGTGEELAAQWAA